MRPVFRLLPLPLCIAFSLAAQAEDDHPQTWALCPLVDAVPAYPTAPEPTGTADDRDSQETKVSGDSVEGTSGETLNLQGDITLSRGDQFLHADNLKLDEATNTYVADGNVHYQDSGMRMQAERASGDQGNDSHEIEDVRYQLVSRRGNGGADKVELKGSEGALIGSTYSTCPPDDRRWELKASRIDVDTDEGFATARSASVRLGKVPVLYIPYFKFPIDDRRLTGLLYPTVGNSSRNGFDWRQPIYINLAPEYDMTLTPRLMTSRGLMLGTEFRYLTDQGHGTLEMDYLPSDDLTIDERDEETAEFIANGYPLENRREEDRGRFSFQGVEKVSKQWNAVANLNWISDPRYVEDMSRSINGISSYQVTSDLGLYGRGRYWDAGLTSNYYQLADYTLSERQLPYYQLPRAYINWEQPLSDLFVASMHGEVARFQHIESDLRPGGTRIDLKPSISMPMGGASWFLNPALAWRYTGYQLDQDLADGIATINGGGPANTSPSTSLPIASVDAGLYFDRHVSFHSDDYLNTLEPRIYYLNSPYRDQDDQPLFDTGALTFSWGQLFRDNRFSGADRQSDANQLTLAVTTRLINESDGTEKLSASLGQITYFEDSRVGLRVNSPVVESGRSAWIGDLNYALNDRWTIGASYQWDPKYGRSDLASLRTRYLFANSGIFNLGYRYRRDPGTGDDLLEQVDMSFLYPINPAWSVVGRYYYSFQDRQLLEGIAGVQWDSCCLAVRLVGRRYLSNRGGELDDSIQVEFELKGLGSAGPDTAGRLRRAILGYYREDLYLVPPPADTRAGADVNTPDQIP